jgi:hypothetical protein
MPELIREPQAQGPRGPELSGALTDLLHGDERAARVELRRQIARLDLELSELFISAFPRRGFSYEVAPAGGPRILGIGELEQVRDRLLSRIADVRALLRDYGDAERRNRLLLERVIAEPERYHWVRVSNEDIGEPGCRHWHSKPKYGLLGMLMGWWRVKVSSGCPLAKGRLASRSSPGWRTRESGAGAAAALARLRPSPSPAGRSSRRLGGRRATSVRRLPGARSRSPS